MGLPSLSPPPLFQLSLSLLLQDQAYSFMERPWRTSFWLCR